MIFFANKIFWEKKQSFRKEKKNSWDLQNIDVINEGIKQYLQYTNVLEGDDENKED